MKKKMSLKEDVQAVANLIEIPFPSIGIDIDGVVDQAPIFFNTLTGVWPGKVFVITFRDNREKAEEVLKKYNIHYNELILVNSFDEKAKVIREQGISVFFDDQPEMLKNVSPTCDVMLVRNEGNFDFKDKKWMLSNQTGKIV